MLDSNNLNNGRAIVRYSNNWTNPNTVMISSLDALIPDIQHSDTYFCPLLNSDVKNVRKLDRFVRFLNGGSKTGHICLVFGHFSHPHLKTGSFGI